MRATHVIATALTAALSLALLTQLSPASARVAQAEASVETVADAELARIEDMLVALYQAFSFEPRQPYDPARFERFFMPGAVFVQPTAPAEVRKIDSLEQFHADFRSFVEGERVQSLGVREVILSTRVEHCGDLAQAWVVFQPSHGDEPIAAHSRGLDGYQLVKQTDGWRVASMTTLFESATRPIPKDF